MKAKGNFFIGLILISISTASLISCDADDDIIMREELKGDVGPQGPEGPEGQPGPEGPEGQPGSVDIYSSTWMKFDYDAENLTPGAGIFNYRTLDSIRITEDVINYAAVFVYAKFCENCNVYALPHIPNSDFSILFELNRNLGLRTELSRYNRSFPAISIWYRYVIIPGNAPAKRSEANSTLQQLYRIGNQSYTLDQLKTMSYEEISSLINN
ncbi:hypothetical protein SAMN05421741_101256 [Paenimyroides ummariense]|uniref:Collagen triple helix repeat-containing protein n=1 Tax=Paenimyroides ummariense TaxID=913024 RepID=A0A1I4WIA9_9FLAO|nr:collagen-like protein [Paenimyroides ummariense]SFN13531.1 hypothetical protein SAMN05421741_101256 [Paenimyroides ummariense]